MTTAVQLLNVAEIAQVYGKKRSYVYRLACLHGWQRVRLGREVYYDLRDVDQVLGHD